MDSPENMFVSPELLNKFNKNFKWNVSNEFNRIIVYQDGVFRCFIGKAYDIKNEKYVVSAHMVVYNDNLDMGHLQCWDPDCYENDDEVIDKIISDLITISAYSMYITSH